MVSALTSVSSLLSGSERGPDCLLREETTSWLLTRLNTWELGLNPFGGGEARGETRGETRGEVNNSDGLGGGEGEGEDEVRGEIT